MINYFEHYKSGYAARTFQNAAASDITFAFAIDFSTAGEVLTKNAVLSAGKKYIAWDLSNPHDRLNRMIRVLNKVGSYGMSGINLNIAGNGIYTLIKYGITQSKIDEEVLIFLEVITDQFNIMTIRSGGQTGVDEAGIKAALKLSIPAYICAPKGWMLRGRDGKDIYDEKIFKERFTLNA